MSLNPATFKIIADYVRSQSGIVLTDDKMYLVESRLLPMVRENNFASFDDIARVIQTKSSTKLMFDVVDAMTTNETLFFRDMTPFTALQEVVVPYLRQNRPNKTLKIWSAACSTGQEPYSILMQLKELKEPLNGWTFDVLATDLSVEALNKAKEAVYNQFEVQRGMPIQLLVKYFTQAGDKWALKPELKSMVKFQNFNLLTPFSGIGTRDIVFIRNVLIYFDQPTKKSILERISQIMAPDGFLFLGGAETIFGITDVFELVPGSRGVYRVSAKAKAAAGQPVKTTAPASASPAQAAKI